MNCRVSVDGTRALMVESGFHMTRLKRQPRSFFLRQESEVASRRARRRTRCLRSTLRISRTRLFIRSVASVSSQCFRSFRSRLWSSLGSLSHFPRGVLLRKALSYLRQRAALASLCLRTIYSNGSYN